MTQPIAIPTAPWLRAHYGTLEDTLDYLRDIQIWIATGGTPVEEVMLRDFIPNPFDGPEIEEPVKRMSAVELERLHEITNRLVRSVQTLNRKTAPKKPSFDATINAVLAVLISARDQYVGVPRG